MSTLNKLFLACFPLHPFSIERMQRLHPRINRNIKECLLTSTFPCAGLTQKKGTTYIFHDAFQLATLECRVSEIAQLAVETQQWHT